MIDFLLYCVILTAVLLETVQRFFSMQISTLHGGEDVASVIENF